MSDPRSRWKLPNNSKHMLRDFILLILGKHQQIGLEKDVWPDPHSALMLQPQNFHRGRHTCLCLGSFLALGFCCGLDFPQGYSVPPGYGSLCTCAAEGSSQVLSGLQIFLLVTPMYDVGVNYFCFFVAAKVLDVLHSKCQDSYNPMDLVSS